jgi:hypothetical protein
LSRRFREAVSLNGRGRFGMEFNRAPEVKVSTPVGEVTVSSMGAGRVVVRTDAHINDDAPGVVWRNESFLLSLILLADDDWRVTRNSEPSVRRRTGFNVMAPPSYAAKLCAVVADAVREYVVDHPEFIAEGERASAGNSVYYALKDLSEAQEALRKAQAAVDAAQERLRAAEAVLR